MVADYQSLLSKRYVVDILSLVYENKEIMATELLRIGTNYKTVKDAADELVENGLMESHVKSEQRLTKTYTLTPKGKILGKRAFESREILFGRMDIEKCKNDAKIKEKKKKHSKKQGKCE